MIQLASAGSFAATATSATRMLPVFPDYVTERHNKCSKHDCQQQNTLNIHNIGTKKLTTKDTNQATPHCSSRTNSA